VAVAAARIISREETPESIMITATITIRDRVAALGRAIAAKDAGAVIAHYAPDVLVFDVQPPLKVAGADAYRQNFERWFAVIDGPIGYEIADLQISAGEDVAFSHSLCKVTSKRLNGERADYWVRVSSGFRKLRGEWMITHEHVSLPIDMRTMQSPPGLEP
jgi:ketosteroid isomerase-like protein